MELFEWVMGAMVAAVVWVWGAYKWTVWAAVRKEEWTRRGTITLCEPPVGIIDRYFYGSWRLGVAWVRWQAVGLERIRRSFFTRVLRGEKPCGTWECGHWEFSNRGAGGFTLQHNNIEGWESIRERDFYMKRYELCRWPLPEKMKGG